jgi:hypothetical protein
MLLIANSSTSNTSNAIPRMKYPVEDQIPHFQLCIFHTSPQPIPYPSHQIGKPLLLEESSQFQPVQNKSMPLFDAAKAQCNAIFKL